MNESELITHVGHLRGALLEAEIAKAAERDPEYTKAREYIRVLRVAVSRLQKRDAVLFRKHQLNTAGLPADLIDALNTLRGELSDRGYCFW